MRPPSPYAPSVGVRVGRLIRSSKGGEGSLPHLDGAASKLRLSAGFRRALPECSSLQMRSGPLALGDLSRSLPCAGGGCAAVLGGLVPCGGVRSGANGVTGSDMRNGVLNVPVQCPVVGPLRHIRHDSIV